MPSFFLLLRLIGRLMTQPGAMERRVPMQALVLACSCTFLGLLRSCSAGPSSATTPFFDVNSIRRMRYSMDDDIALSFDPKTLTKSGAWVTVSWAGVQSPTNTDFIAAYSPASATPISTAPVKYKYASSASDHLTKGQGTVAFRLVNLGDAYWFAFFRGNVSNPVLAAKSDTIRFAAHAEPLGIHLALTSDPRQMRVTWKTAQSADQPQVQFYALDHKDNVEIAQATTSTYTVDDLCGEPAKSVGYSEPGYIHTAVMTGLSPRTGYAYRVGDAAIDVWSDESTFVSSPAVGALDNKKVVLSILADMSMAEPDGSLQAGYFANDFNSLNTSRYLQYRSQVEGDLDAAVCIGDLSYATGYLSHWDSWLDQIEPLAKHVPLMVSPGNHERDDPNVSPYHSSVSFYHNNEGGGECGVPYSALFPMPAPAQDPRSDTPWYSFDLGPVHFVAASTEHDFRAGSAQYQWLADDLQGVDRQVTPWLVFMGHRPLYLDSTDDSPDPFSPSEQAAARLLRSELEPLLNQYRVDLVLSGHHHSYQRTCKLVKGECVAAASEGGAYKGPVYVVVGMGGRRLSTNFLPSVPSYLEYLSGKAYGVTVLEADRSHLSLTFIDVSNGAKLDSITLTVPRGGLGRRPDEGERARRGMPVPLGFLALVWVLLAIMGVGLVMACYCPGTYKQVCSRIGRYPTLLGLMRRVKASDSPPQTEMSSLLEGNGMSPPRGYQDRSVTV